jgi:tRNA 2-thiouridine synthesizing protein A
MAIVTTIDARGLACPLPLALAKRRMAELEAGETLLVLATDPEAPIDLAAWAAEQGHAFAEHDSGEGWSELRVRKAAPGA